MPIYEYRCQPCDHNFETLVRRPTDVARCPRCGGVELAKQFSVPAAAQTGQSAGGPLPVCGPGPGPQSFGCGGGPCGSGMCAMD